MSYFSIKLDTAVASVLSVEPTSCIVIRHGNSTAALSWKIQLSKEPRKQYFLKTTVEKNDMLKGEYESLKTMHTIVPSFCPKSFYYGELTDTTGTFLLMQFVDTRRTITRPDDVVFARRLAKLHMTRRKPSSPNASHFGFHVPTFVGSIKQDNTWKSSWAKFFADNRLRAVAAVVSVRYPSEQVLVRGVEKAAKQVVPKLLADAHLNEGRGVRPALIHGDLWCDNKVRGVIYKEDARSQIPDDYVVDAACYYAHSEFELALMRMLGGFSSAVFKEYHKHVPRTRPVAEYDDRMALYQLYHWLVNYAISGEEFRDKVMEHLNKLLWAYGDD